MAKRGSSEVIADSGAAWTSGDNPEQRAEEGRRCRTYVEREYTWDQTAAQYMDLLTGRS